METTTNNYSNGRSDYFSQDQIPDLLTKIGLEYKESGDELIVQRCPFCHAGTQDPTNQYKLSINPKKGVYNCLRCDSRGTTLQFQRELERMADDQTFVKTAPANTSSGNADYARKLWSEAQPAESTLAAQYLKMRGPRGRIPASIRFHPALHYKDVGSDSTAVFSGLIAAVKNKSGEITGAQRIYLDGEGKKANVSSPKKALGDIMGGACRFAEPEEVLLIAEGVETALAVFEATGLPTWSAISAKGLENVVVPPQVKEVHIYADLDRSNTGQAAAEKLATGLHSKGVHSFIHFPPGPIPLGAKGVDWLDVFNKNPQAIMESLDSVSEWRLPAFQNDDQDWPEPISKDGQIGFVGEMLKVLAPQTEADPAALALQFLVMFGNVMGRRPIHRIGTEKHHFNMYVLLIGDSSKARKGTSFNMVLSLFETTFPEWVKSCIKAGLTSGEGLIHHVRDPLEMEVSRQDKETKEIIVERKIKDAGVSDKRLLAYESEFSGPLVSAAREGSTLSPVIRNAWDRGDLSTLSKNSPETATNAHVSIIGHITAKELSATLSEVNMSNGFSNRFLHATVRRSQLLPRGGYVPEAEMQALQNRLRPIVHFASKVDEVTFSEEAFQDWERVYPTLTDSPPGIFGAIVARAEAHVRRIACLYALLDCTTVVEKHHLRAALAVWEFCEASCRYVFGDYLEDPIANAILERLRRVFPRGMSRNELRDEFDRKVSSAKMTDALKVLLSENLVRFHLEETGGRPSERWFAVYKEKTHRKGFPHLSALNAPEKTVPAEDGENG